MDRLELRSRRGALAVLGCALTLIALLALSGKLASPAGSDRVTPSLISPGLADAAKVKRKARGLPNIIVITTDDQAQSVYGPRFMPQTFQTIGAHADTARFSQALALPPVCCPYRASFLTGQYPHNNGVFANHPGYKSLRGKGNTLPVWLERQGYYTAVAGKYLNGTAEELARRGEAQAPGWDEWFVRTGESSSYFDVEFRDRRRKQDVSELRDPPESRYFTDVLTSRVKEFLDDRAVANAKGRRQPFFLWVPHLAPHAGKDTDRGDQNECSRSRYPSVRDDLLDWAQQNIDSEREVARLPAFNEDDMSDKPGRSRKKKRLDAEKIALITQGFECAAAAIKAVDESNAAIWDKLGELDMRRNTIIVFTSDNGYYYGEHRLVLKKGVPYEPALRIPLMMKVPAAYNQNGQSPPGRIDAITGQIDLAPTLLDYAGAPRGSCQAKGECRTMDGRSLRAVLGDRAQPSIGRLNATSFLGRSMLVERVKPCFWPALRTPRFLYSIDPFDGTSKKPDCGGIRAHEIYDLDRDPEQDKNLAKRKKWEKKIEDRFLPKLLELRRCKGVERRDRERGKRPFCE